MPRRYLARHAQGHAPARVAALTVDAEPAPAPEAGPDPQPLDDGVTPGKQRAGMQICPACAVFVAPAEFSDHMLAQHSHWCPLCQAQTRDLAGHLSSTHRLKPILPAPAYLRSWQTQPRFICLGCQKKVSVRSYPKHEQPTAPPAHRRSG